MVLDTPSLYALRALQVSRVHYSMMSSARALPAPARLYASTPNLRRLARSPFAHLPARSPFAVRLLPIALSILPAGGSPTLNALRAFRLPSVAFLSSRSCVLFSPGGCWGRGISCALLFSRHAPHASRQASPFCARRSALGTQPVSLFGAFYYSCGSINRFTPRTSLPCLTCQNALVVLPWSARLAPQAALDPIAETANTGPYRFWRYDCIARLEHTLERSSMQFWTFEHAVDRLTGSILPKRAGHSSLGTLAIAVLLERFPSAWCPDRVQRPGLGGNVPPLLWPSSLRPVGDTHHFPPMLHQDSRGVKKMPFTEVRRLKPLTHPLHSDEVSALKRVFALVLSCADVPHYNADGVKGGIFSSWCHDTTVTHKKANSLHGMLSLHVVAPVVLAGLEPGKTTLSGAASKSHRSKYITLFFSSLSLTCMVKGVDPANLYSCTNK